MKLNFGEIRKIFPAHTLNLSDSREVVGICHDSRAVKAGELFVAIRGPRFDGHDYVKEAFARGACAAVVEKQTIGFDNLIVVSDTIHALARLALYYRGKFSQPVIAITGSSGKTTVKDWLAHVLGLQGKVVATQGNRNNHIGVPLTVFQFCEDADFFIVEMGMNHPGEIRSLSEMVRPTMGLITSVGQAHLEGVGRTLEDVAKAKAELFDALDDEGMALICLDDERIRRMETRARRVTFGSDATCHFRVSGVKYENGESCFVIRYQGRECKARIPFVGPHQVRNALAVASAAFSLGLSEEVVLKGLESFRLPSHRGHVVQKSGWVIVDDTYNANPDSIRAAAHSLCLAWPSHYKIAVLGDMLELGEQSADLHLQVGKGLKEFGVDEILACGKVAREYLRGFGYDGAGVASRLFDTHEKTAGALKKVIANQTRESVVLLKGSRGMVMEKVLNYLD